MSAIKGRGAKVRTVKQHESKKGSSNENTDSPNLSAIDRASFLEGLQLNYGNPLHSTALEEDLNVEEQYLSVSVSTRPEKNQLVKKGKKRKSGMSCDPEPQHGDADIPSIHSVCRRVAHLTRHQSPFMAGSNRARNIARLLHEYTESIARPPHTKDNLLVYDLGVSDHKTISMELSFQSPLSMPNRQIRFRNLRNINPNTMTLDLQHLSSANFSSRRLKASGLTVHRLADREHQKAYAQSLRDARSQYYSSLINNSTGNSKQLFSTINHLLKPQSPLHSDSTEKQCSNFAAFFTNKVDTIRSLLSSPSAPPVTTADPQPGTTQPLRCFTDISQREEQSDSGGAQQRRKRVLSSEEEDGGEERSWCPSPKTARFYRLGRSRKSSSEKSKSKKSSSGSASPEPETASTDKQRKRQRGGQGGTQLEVVLEAFLDFCDQYRESLESNTLKECVDSFSSNVENQLLEKISTSKELKVLKRENIKVASSIRTKTQRLLDAKNELMSMVPPACQLCY
ncbi:hypothetical protein JOQ06_024298 [Pogonophryne albipinna]|uniref:Centromere protein U n=1 Tax=Pogonophryne albipinna TaxID=1090488 RepID=A0AAD6BQX2_9TELE|nr:hypothetical protein JOQ06_024298 [Pogonophryne albipinna]